MFSASSIRCSLYSLEKLYFLRESVLEGTSPLRSHAALSWVEQAKGPSSARSTGHWIVKDGCNSP